MTTDMGTKMDTYEIIVERNGETVFRCKTLAQIVCENENWLHTTIDDKNIQCNFAKQKDLCPAGLFNFLQLLFDIIAEGVDYVKIEGEEK